MSHDREIELKLEIEPESVPRMHALPALGNAQSKSQNLCSTYFDTKKNGLRKAGVSLRVRRSGDRFIQTVKLAGASAGLFSRSEWEWDVRGSKPDRDLLEATPAGETLGSSRLVPLFETSIERSTWIVQGPESEIEVALDQGAIIAGKRTAAICELELELKRGDVRALFALARALADAVPVRLAVLSKADRGFALADDRLGFPARAEAVTVSAEMSVQDGFSVIVHSCLKHFRLNELPLARDRDRDGLHQARVAMRRLRSAFSLFRPALQDAEFDAIREELRWFTGELGDARNLDVLIESRRAAEGEGGVTDLVQAREQAYERVISAAGSQRFQNLMLELVRWIETGEWRSKKRARQPLPPFALKRLERLWSHVAAPGMDPANLGEEERHRLRIEIKKLRYASEFLAGLFPESRAEWKRFGKSLQGLQENLGYLHDMVTARAILGDQQNEAREIMGGSGNQDAEKQHLRASRKDLRQLIKMGPFWRADEPANALECRDYGRSRRDGRSSRA